MLESKIGCANEVVFQMGYVSCCPQHLRSLLIFYQLLMAH